ncbi:prostaglandin reductase-3-like [Uloborus diversus]|uniref:prostaglandin reductase-3-like n=1 Tax=Uloborus diversus TaxID=327109 RepID=UPI00240A34A1|nr:prostaglandin reductase-3-like [Uloborus diversus]
MIRNIMASARGFSSSVPKTFRRLVVKKLTPAFKDAVDIVHEELVRPAANEVLIKNKYVGINASDVNVAAGRYFKEKPSVPTNIGFEAIGEVVDIGENVLNETDLKYGQAIMYMKLGAFSEFMYLPAEEVIPINAPNPNLLPLLVSGSSASLSLDKCGRIVPGEKVLITAAAGGTGHIAVQWAKNAGCHVIGTCSSEEKVDFLKTIGCDRPINYKKESLDEVLHKEYPNGIDVIWEAVGGKLFPVLQKHLAIKGRLVIIGAVSQYLKENMELVMNNDLPFKLLSRSTTFSGFLLPHYLADIPHYMSLMVQQFHEQILKTQIDDGSSLGNKFSKLEDIPKAVEYLYSGKNKGKIIVQL